jgi:folate-dependent phosphoribosylglycinamide formyltransferase PurN
VPRPSPAREGTVVLLAGTGDTTDIVANYLAPRVPRLELIVENAPSRVRMARRRAIRVGWPAVIGQVCFVAVALPLLRWRGRHRIEAIVAGAGLATSPYPGAHHVRSVNDQETIRLLRTMHPTVIVVNGTRIISSDVLDAMDCPFINTHAGITPRFRGVHGGYWALVEGRPEMVGTTVHLVDEGIDTGGVLARAAFDTSQDDSVATYPYLHLVAGLPHLADQVERVLAGEKPSPLEEEIPPGGTRLYLHPTLWQYVRQRFVKSVR